MKKILLRTALGMLLLLLLLCVAAFLFPQQCLCVDSGPVKADALIVLGGGSYERPKRAAELFHQQAAPRLIVSGFGDCEINRRILIGAGVPGRAIQTEPKSRTTRENAEFTVQLLRRQKVKSAIVVTSWYHSRRALECFEHYAPEIQFYSRPSYYAYARAEWRREGISRRIRWEYPKLLGYWVRYGVCPF